jgi:DNA polymerase-3 subunit delta'
MWQVFERGWAVPLLERSLASGRLANAYLIVGPAHVGKMTLAINFAQALNCTSPEPPCGECVSCRKILSGKHADVQVIDLASNGKDKPKTEISTDQIQEIQHASNLPPFEGQYKVFVINNAELLSASAANRLLKTLEEPSGKTLYLLLTVNDRLLPATVVSRCQKVELPPLQATKIEEALLQRWHLDPERARLLSRLARGSLGWAVNALNDDILVQQRTDLTVKMLKVIKGNLNERFLYAAELANEHSRDRAAIPAALELWLIWWYDLMLVLTGNENRILKIDHGGELSAMAKLYNLSEVYVIIGCIRQAMAQIRLNASPRLVLETVMLAIPRRYDGRNRNN